MEKPGFEIGTPGLRDIGLSPTPRCLSPTPKKLFVAFLGCYQFCLVGFRFVCCFYDGNTQRLTQSGFMEKPGIEPATPSLQDISLSPTPFCCLPGYQPVLLG